MHGEAREPDATYAPRAIVLPGIARVLLTMILVTHAQRFATNIGSHPTCATTVTTWGALPRFLRSRR
jgi:hypothetical protein